MSNEQQVDTKGDLKTTSQIETKTSIKSCNNRKNCILIGIITRIVVILAVVLLALLLIKKRKNSNEDFNQTIELLIDGNEIGKSRNLQEEEKVQILGKNFNELNSSNSFIFLNDDKITFDKYLFIKSSSFIKVVIRFTGKITTFMEMFAGCNKIKEISLINVETDFISDVSSMFENCTSLTGVKFKNMTINNITRATKMFHNCPNLNIIDIENFSTNKSKDMSKMFKGCTSLSNTSFIETLSTNNAEFLNEMFSDCSSIKSLDLLGYDTSNAKNMSGLFKGMSNLEEIELSSFHTEKVEDMSGMFESCIFIKNINLSNFNTEMVTTMDNMFANCLELIILDVTSFSLPNCKSTKFMFSNTTRELMLSIEKNEELMENAGASWSEKKYAYDDATKAPLDILFLVDATGSMGGEIEKVKEDIIYIAVNLLKKKGMEKYDLSLAALFYRDPIDSPSDINEIFDFDKNALNFKNFIKKITAMGGSDFPEDWAGAFNLAKNLSWGEDSTKFIIHIADAPGHGIEWAGEEDIYPEEGIKTDEIITYFAKKNFIISGFKVGADDGTSLSFERAKKIFEDNGNNNYFIQEFSVYNEDKDYLLNLVYDSFQNTFIDDAEIIKREI